MLTKRVATLLLLPLLGACAFGAAERPPKPIGTGEIEARDWSFESRWYPNQGPESPGQQDHGWRPMEGADGNWRWVYDPEWTKNTIPPGR